MSVYIEKNNNKIIEKKEKKYLKNKKNTTNNLFYIYDILFKKVIKQINYPQNIHTRFKFIKKL